MARRSSCNTTHNGTSTKNVMLFFTVAFFATFTLLTMHLVYPFPPSPKFGISILFAFSCENCKKQEKFKTIMQSLGVNKRCGNVEVTKTILTARLHIKMDQNASPQNKSTMQFDIKSTKSHALLKMDNFSAPYVSANAKIVELLFPYSIETRF